MDVNANVDDNLNSTADDKINNSSEDPDSIYSVNTAEEINEILKLINLDPEDVAPVVQHLYSCVPIDQQCTDYKILELDDHLRQALESGESLSFRGQSNEEAVLCSSSRTYAVREAETSNTCLLVPNLKLKDQVFVEGLTEKVIEQVEVKGVFSTYLEVRECIPRLSKMTLILEPSSFKGVEYETCIEPSTLYDWEKLRNEIQASDEEIKAALPKYLIVEMDGYYRLISFEFEARALPWMLDLIEDNSWQIDEIDKEVAYEELRELVPEPVFEVLFQKYTELSTKTKQDGTPLYKYVVSKCSQFLAQILLTTSPLNDYDDFMTAWKMGSPDEIDQKEEYLYGIGIVVQKNQSSNKKVMFYPESNLPDDINKRLGELFKVKEKWTVQEITPYIEKFATRNQDVNAILTKYARASTVNNVKYYSAKHGR